MRDYMYRRIRSIFNMACYLFILNVLDIGTTYWAMSLSDLIVEGNPFARWLMGTHDALLIAAKLALPLMLAYMATCMRRCSRWFVYAMALCVLYYAFIVANNVLIIIYFYLYMG